MKKSISSKLLIIGLLTLFGCAAKKQMVVQKPAPVIKAPVTDTAHNAAALLPAHLTPDQLTAIQQKQIGFSTFTAKAKAKINIDGNTNDVTLNIRIKKNQEIWISITAVLGLEGARALITPDSIKIINRLESTYLKKPFSYVYQYAGNQVSYQTLEALIVGNALPGTLNDVAALQNINGSQVLSGNMQGLLYQLVIDANMRVSQTTMSASSPSRTLQVNNSGALQAQDRIIPSQININSSAQSSKIQIAFTYSKADFNTIPEFPFAVPARYSVVN